MVNMKKATGQDSVTMGNGVNVSASTIAKIPGTCCDKYGVELSSAKNGKRIKLDNYPWWVRLM